MHKTVAIVGSGPAGMACANYLNSSGFKVTVFDELKEFGGMLAYGIPEFRIPLQNVKEKIAEAKKQGISFGRKKITSVNELLAKPYSFNFIVLAIGAGANSKAGFIGEDNGAVLDSLDFLSKAKLEGISLVGKKDKVAVIGGGNSAIDSARTAVRQGAKVTIVYRRTEEEMPALKSEVLEAKNDGIKLELLRAPLEFKSGKDKKKGKLICSEMILGEADERGRRKPIDTGKKEEYAFDKIIVAVGQEQDLNWLASEGIKINGKTIMVDSNYKTNLDNVYACGDSVTGARTIGEAVKGGLLTAKAILAQSQIVKTD
ncbi:MAG: FAD-dependent oxidoreductase [archaeon]|jgi:NADPH-dependent glutamate synthase beta subunit-like oxidoreductase